MRFRFVAWQLVVMVLLLGVPGLSQASEADVPVAEIDGQPILMSEFLLYLRQINPQIDFGRLPSSEQQRHLETFLEKKVVAIEARRLKIDQEPDVKARLDFFVEGVLLSEFNSRMRGQIEVTDEQIAEYYREHQQSFVSPARYFLEHLVYRTPEKAVDARQQLVEGTSAYVELARQKGADPDLVFVERKWLSQQTLLPELREKVGRLAVGEMTEGIYTNYGYHILRLVDLEPERQTALEEVRARIELMVRRERMAELRQQMIQEILQRHKARIVR